MSEEITILETGLHKTTSKNLKGKFIEVKQYSSNWFSIKWVLQKEMVLSVSAIEKMLKVANG